MREIISQLAENSSSRPLLLVPEQFSFETERIMLELLGPKNLKNIEAVNIIYTDAFKESENYKNFEISEFFYFLIQHYNIMQIM